MGFLTQAPFFIKSRLVYHKRGENMNNVGVCLIGAGRAGMIHARNYVNKVPGAHMEAVADAVEETAKAAAAELGIKKYYTDYRDAVMDDAVDAVVVVSPTNLHKDIVVYCANAGKHIFCEKPMAMNAEECKTMVEACERNKVKLQIGFMRRFDTNYRRAKERLDAGEIGELVMIRSCTRGPSRPREWMYDIRKSNGILAEVNSHDIDTVRWMAGSNIKTMHVEAGNYRNKQAEEGFPDYYDNVIMMGQLENGVQYIIDGAVYVKYGYDAQVELLGTRGCIRIGRAEADSVVTVSDTAGMSRPFVSSWTELFKDAYLEEDKSFIKAIIEDSETLVTGFDGMMAVCAVEEGNSIITKNMNHRRNAE